MTVLATIDARRVAEMGGPVMGNDVVAILKRHLDPSLEMLQRVVDRCPSSLWLDDKEGPPFWQVAYHVIFYIEHWLREDYAVRQSRCLVPKKQVSPDLGRGSPDHLTQAELKDYLARVREKVDRIFATLDDGRLSAPIRPRSSCTYHDAILGQVRHIQHHVGQCNNILRRAGARTAGWSGYGEG